MGLNCGCPAGAHIPDLEIADCKESLGQVQKVIFQRIYKAGGQKNSITMTGGKLTKASITALMSAADGTKAVISPYIQNPSTEPGEARTFGGGNQTLGGVEIIIGREPTPFTGVIYQEQQSTIKQLKGLQCENIGVYLIDENGSIAGVSTAAGSISPIPIGKFFVGDKNLGGFEEPDSNAISWNFFPNWSDDLLIVKSSEMDFNALTDIVNVKSAS